MPRVDPSRYEIWGARNPHCTSCILHEGATTVCVPTVRLKESLPHTSASPAVVCIGQNPGSEEDKAGVPFVGPSGGLLVDGYLVPANIHKLATIYITNDTRCLTAMNKVPPFVKCRRPCFNLYTQPDLLKIAHLHAPHPLYILCVGGPAAADVYRLLLGERTGPSQDVAIARNGRTHAVPGFPVPVVVFATMHPAFIMRVPNNIEEVHHHMGQLQRHLVGDLPTVTKPTLIAPTPP